MDGRQAGTSGIKSHRDLIVWQKAMDLVDAVYDVLTGLPPREDYALRAQMVRAIISVPANIAEGHARSTRKDFANFLAIARASLMETDTLLAVAVRRRYVTDADAEKIKALIEEVSKMLTTLRGRLAPRQGGR